MAVEHQVSVLLGTDDVRVAVAVVAVFVAGRTGTRHWGLHHPSTMERIDKEQVERKANDTMEKVSF
jgi:hypothetical protein